VDEIGVKEIDVSASEVTDKVLGRIYGDSRLGPIRDEVEAELVRATEDGSIANPPEGKRTLYTLERLTAPLRTQSEAGASQIIRTALTVIGAFLLGSVALYVYMRDRNTSIMLAGLGFMAIPYSADTLVRYFNLLLNSIRIPAGSQVIIGVKGIPKARMKALKAVFAGEKAAMINVTSEKELADAAKAKGLPAILIDSPDTIDMAILADYVKAIKVEAATEAARTDIANLARCYEIIHTAKMLSPALREKIRALIVSILPDAEIVDIDKAIESILVRGVTPEMVGQIQQVRELARGYRAELGAYNTMPMPADTTGKNMVIAVTEETALQDPSFANNIKTAKAGSGTQTVFLYGNKFKGLQDAQRFVMEAGCNLEDLKFVKIGASYDELLGDIRMETGLDMAQTSNIGIMAAKGEIKFADDERPGDEKFLEIQKVSVGGTVVLATMNAYKALLNIIIAADSQLPPGVTSDGRIFKYLPPALPIDYGRAISVYRDAMILISTAA